MTGADLLVEELQARKVPFVATLNGHGLDPFYLACQRAGMRVIDVRNEQAAGYMAEATGRLSRRVGVAAVSGGVAHANALTGVLNAWFDGAPMLLITGMTPLSRLGLGDFQDFNPVPMASPICKFARLLDVPERIPQLVQEAFAAATTGRPGPVHLALPLDVASASLDSGAILRSPIRRGGVQVEGAAPPEQVEEVVRLIKKSQRPLLVAGSGVYYSRGEAALEQFSLQQKIPVTVPIWDRGSVSRPLETYVGVLGAASGGPRLLEDADLILLAGAEFDYRVGQISPPVLDPEAQVVRIHADAARLRQGLEAHWGLPGAPATVLLQLAEACRRQACPPSEKWLEEARRRRQQFVQGCLEASERLPAGMNGRDLVEAVRQVLTDETILLVDGGNIGQWFHQLMDFYPGRCLTCGASGVVGWGLPGALAARALDPEAPVLLLSGDGSFTFTVAELECAARQNLPFVAVVADDEQWGITVTGQVSRYGRALYSKLGPTRLDQVAEGFGCRGLRVEKKEDLIPAIREGLASPRPVVLQVPIVPGGPGG